MSAIAGERSSENSCASSSSGTDRAPASVPATPSILTTTARPAPSSTCHGRTRKSSPLSWACHTARRELGEAAKPADRSDVPKAHVCSGKKVRRTAEAEGREGGKQTSDGSWTLPAEPPGAPSELWVSSAQSPARGDVAAPTSQMRTPRRREEREPSPGHRAAEQQRLHPPPGPSDSPTPH